MVSMLPAIEKEHNILGDDIMKLNAENTVMKIETGDYDKKNRNKVQKHTIKEQMMKNNLSFSQLYWKKHNYQKQKLKKWVVKAMTNLIEVNVPMKFPGKIKNKTEV